MSEPNPKHRTIELLYDIHELQGDVDITYIDAHSVYPSEKKNKKDILLISYEGLEITLNLHDGNVMSRHIKVKTVPDRFLTMQWKDLIRFFTEKRASLKKLTRQKSARN